MTESVKIGPYRVRPEIRAGRLTRSWFLDIPRSIAGSRQRVLFANRELAIQAAKDLLRGFANQSLKGLRAIKSQRSISFSEAEEQWLEEQERRVELRKKAASSLDRDKWNLKAARAFFGDIALDQITHESLEKFQSYRQNRGRKPDTINSDTQMVCLPASAFGPRASRRPRAERCGPEPPRSNTGRGSSDYRRVA